MNQLWPKASARAYRAFEEGKFCRIVLTWNDGRSYFSHTPRKPYARKRNMCMAMRGFANKIHVDYERQSITVHPAGR